MTSIVKEAKHQNINRGVSSAHFRVFFRKSPEVITPSDAWYGNFTSTFGCSDKVQWLSAAEAFSTGMLVSCFCGYFLSDTKCDLKPSKIQRYLGML